MNIKKTNEELIALIRSGTNVQENMGLLLEKNHGLVCLIAKKTPTSSVVDLDDLIQEGNLGLMKAVDSYDESKGAFTTHAGFWIQGTIKRNTETLMYDKKLPAYMVNLISKYRRFCAEHRIENTEPPSDAELLQGLGITKKALKGLRQTLNTIHSVSLNDAVPGAEDLTYGDSVADPVDVSDMVIENVYQNQCNEVLWKHIESLRGLDAIVIAERFFKNKSIQDIAEKYNLSRQRIDQIERKVLALLQEKAEIQALVGDFDYRTESLKRTGFEAWKESMESSVERTIRKKEDWEIIHQKRFERLEQIKAEMDDANTLKAVLLECEAEQRKRIESIFQHQFDEIVPHVLELPPKAREVFILIYVCGMKGSDVAKEMNVGRSAVSMNKSVAVSRLQAALAVS